MLLSSIEVVIISRVYESFYVVTKDRQTSYYENTTLVVIIKNLSLVIRKLTRV